MTTEVEDKVIKVKIEVPKPHSAKQEEFVRSVALRQVIKAGRRFGKTVGAAIKALEAFLGVCPACGGEGCLYCDNTGKVIPVRVLYAAPTAEQVGKFWYEITTALSSAVEEGYLKKDETEKYIEVPGTEQRIKAKTAWNANTLRGDFAGLLILEEYQLMNEDTWEEVGQPMLLDNNGRAVLIYTPPSLKAEGISKARDPRHASKMFKKAEADTSGRWQTFHFTSFDNPTLSQEALKEIGDDMSKEAFRREILAEDDEIELSWLVYGTFNEEMCKIKPFIIPETWPVLTGHDFGTANPAALFVAQVKLPLPDGAPKHLRYGDYVAFKEYAPGAGFSAPQHVDKFKEFTKDRNLSMSVGGNITTEEEVRQLYRKEGWAIRVPLINRVNAQIDRVLSLIEQNQFYVFEDMYQLLAQIANCMWTLDEEKRPTNKVKDDSKYHLLACFVAGTMIKTVQGEKPIEDIRIGDEVLTREGYNRVTTAEPTGRDREVLTAIFSDGSSLTGTPDHPVYVKEKGWVDLTCLRYGDITVPFVVKPSRQINTYPPELAQEDVSFLYAKPHSKATVYNLSVENVPEYYANGILVHNCLRYLATVLNTKVSFDDEVVGRSWDDDVTSHGLKWD